MEAIVVLLAVVLLILGGVTIGLLVRVHDLEEEIQGTLKVRETAWYSRNLGWEMFEECRPFMEKVSGQGWTLKLPVNTRKVLFEHWIEETSTQYQSRSKPIRVHEEAVRKEEACGCSTQGTSS